MISTRPSKSVRVTPDASHVGSNVYLERADDDAAVTVDVGEDIGENHVKWRVLRDDVVVKREPDLKSKKVKQITLKIGDVVEQIAERKMQAVSSSIGRSVHVVRIPIRANSHEGWVTPGAAHVG